MLVMQKNGTPRIICDEVLPAGSVEVRAIRFVREVRIASPAFNRVFRVGDIAPIGPDCPEEVALSVLNPQHTAARFDAFPDAVVHVPVEQPAAKETCK